jgi:hypothetical protein
MLWAFLSIAGRSVPMFRISADLAATYSAFALTMAVVTVLSMSLLTALDAAAATNGHAPKHCEPTMSAWWAKYVGRYVESAGRHGVDLANSDPAAGFAHMVWSNGLQQMVTVAEIDGHGTCTVERRTIAPYQLRAISPAPSARPDGQ